MGIKLEWLMRFAAGVGACSALPFTLKFILGANPKSRAIYITRVANYPLPLTEKLSAKKKRTGFQSKLSQIRTKRKLIILRVGILILLKSKLEKDTNKERNRLFTKQRQFATIVERVRNNRAPGDRGSCNLHESVCIRRKNTREKHGSTRQNCRIHREKDFQLHFRLQTSPSFLNHLLCVIISDFVATLESRSPFPFWSSFSRVRAVLFEGWTTKGVGWRATERERHWTRKALFPLYEFNPALSRHGLLFQTRGRHSTMRRRRRYIKRRVLFCKCAPGNWSSCCSSFGFFVCHFNQDLRRKEVLGVQSVQAGNPRRLCTVWRIFARIFFSPSFVKIELLWTIGKNNSKWK